MTFYSSIFLGCKFSVLGDDPFRYADLSDVMKQRSIVNIFTFLTAHSADLSKLSRILRYSCRMAVSVLVLGIDSVYKSCCRLIEQSVEITVFLLFLKEIVLVGENGIDHSSYYKKTRKRVKIITFPGECRYQIGTDISEVKEHCGNNNVENQHYVFCLSLKNERYVYRAEDKPYRRAAADTAVCEEHGRQKDKNKYDRKDHFHFAHAFKMYRKPDKHSAEHSSRNGRQRGMKRLTHDDTAAYTAEKCSQRCNRKYYKRSVFYIYRRVVYVIFDTFPYFYVIPKHITCPLISCRYRTG